MAKIPTFICFGNSNTDGFASFNSLGDSAFQKWTGISPPAAPYDVSVPGVRIWTPKLPSTPVTEYTVTAATGTTVDLSGLTHDSGTHDDRWLFVKEGTGIGQYRRITGGSGDELTVSPAWTTNPDTDSTIEFLSNSHTCDSLSTTTSVISELLVGNPAGKWIVFVSGVLAGRAQRIVVGASKTLTLEYALIVAPSAGDGFVICSNTGTVDGLSTNIAANGSLRELTFYASYGYHYSTGYDYANFKSYPYDGDTGTVGPNALRALNRINWLPELAWQIRQSVGTAPVFVHVGIPSASMRTQYTGSLAKQFGAFSRLYDVDHLDYQPSSPNNGYGVLTTDITNTATALVAEGNEIDIQGIFAVVTDVDALAESYATKALDNLTKLVASLRQFIDTNSYSSKSAAKIPFVVADVAGTAFAAQATVNTAVAQVAEDDPYLVRVDTAEYTLNGDNVHWATDACQQFGVDAADAWAAALTDESDATRVQDDLPTLADIRTKVLRRYERTVTSNDAQNVQITQFVNDSLREVYNTLGDQAWFLRRMEQMTLNPAYPSTLTLPRRCKRLIAVESTVCPGRAVVVKGLGYTDQGRIEAVLHDYTGGPYRVHYLVIPKDLEQDNDTTLVPLDYIELVVMLTCKRLAESGGNVAIASYYAVELERLWKYVKRDVGRYDRMRLHQINPLGGYDVMNNGPAGPSSWSL